MISYRPGTVEDIESVLALWREAETEPSATDDAESLALCLAHDPDCLIVALDGTKVVGSIIAGWDGWRGALYRLAVAPSRRRLGIAMDLMRRGEEHLASRGARRLHNIVLKSNEASLKLHQGLGWHIDQRVLRLIKNRQH